MAFRSAGTAPSDNCHICHPYLIWTWQARTTVNEPEMATTLSAPDPSTETCKKNSSSLASERKGGIHLKMSSLNKLETNNSNGYNRRHYICLVMPPTFKSKL